MKVCFYTIEFLQTVFIKWEKNYATELHSMITPILMSWFKTFHSNQKTQKAQKGERLIFKEEVADNADLHKT